MQVHLVNPSHVSFGIGVITPRWLYVLAAATPRRVRRSARSPTKRWKSLDLATIKPGDVVGIGIHTGNALRGYEVGTRPRAAGAWVVFGGIHATLYPDEPHELGGAHAVVKGDGDAVWGRGPRATASRGTAQRVYDGGRIEAGDVPAGALGPAAAGPLHVGVGADGPRLSQALLVLLGVADRRAAAAPARRPTR